MHMSQKMLLGRTLEFPTKVLFSCMFNHRSSNAGLTTIKALGPGNCIRVCVWLDCFNHISLSRCSSYYYLHVEFKKHVRNAYKGGWMKLVQSLVLNADLLRMCIESIAILTALKKDLPKPFYLKILLLTTVSVVFSFSHCSGKPYVPTGHLHIKAVCWK